jgi:hypothetical protein
VCLLLFLSDLPNTNSGLRVIFIPFLNNKL